ncbi:MAG TPA: hypothetical protein PKG96_10695 [Bacilli bacterium]|jgi:hypothetical protein|nr:hypothetical protein [Bacilli bacterium]
MAIVKAELEIMNDLISKGTNISDLAKKYPQYDYWEIYWSINDYSILGKKRSITNRLNLLVKTQAKDEREKIAAEAQAMLNELYELLKGNSSKLLEIDRILRK